VGSELFHADGQIDGLTERRTGMTKLIVAFLNFANAPKTFAGVEEERAYGLQGLNEFDTGCRPRIQGNYRTEKVTLIFTFNPVANLSILTLSV
jgi:hypothetical protein